MALQNVVANIKPYFFQFGYQDIPARHVAGLNYEVGDRLAKRTITSAKADGTPFKAQICRLATPRDLAEFAARGKARPAKTEPLVPVEFDRNYLNYRGPSQDKKADIAGFTLDEAKKLCEGFLDNEGNKVGSVGHYYVVVAEGVEVEAEGKEPELEKPRVAKPRKLKRQKAALDEAPEQK